MYTRRGEEGGASLSNAGRRRVPSLPPAALRGGLRVNRRGAQAAAPTPRPGADAVGRVRTAPPRAWPFQLLLASWAGCGALTPREPALSFIFFSPPGAPASPLTEVAWPWSPPLGWRQCAEPPRTGALWVEQPEGRSAVCAPGGRPRAHATSGERAAPGHWTLAALARGCHGSGTVVLWPRLVQGSNQVATCLEYRGMALSHLCSCPVVWSEAFERDEEILTCYLTTVLCIVDQ